MNVRTEYIHRVLLFVLLFSAWTINAAEPTYEIPLLDGRALLIRDPAIVNDLKLTEAQSGQLRQLADTLDAVLFSLRDAPRRPTDKNALAAIKQVDTQLSTLSNILNPAQNTRLGQLWRQYEGIDALFRPEVGQELKLTEMQSQQILNVYLQQQATISKNDSAERIRQIQNDRIQQTVDILTDTQRKQWFQMGKVVVVHFWTHSCINCIRNYPAYKDWAGRFNPDTVVVLGIHTPEFESEKDAAAIKQKAGSEGLTFPIAVDNDKANWNAWFNRMWPSIYLVDKNGRVRFWWYGELNWQGATGDKWILERINMLLREKPDAN
jgi:thiol-disulfide isomerase/thioredoxin